MLLPQHIIPFEGLLRMFSIAEPQSVKLNVTRHGEKNFHSTFVITITRSSRWNAIFIIIRQNFYSWSPLKRGNHFIVLSFFVYFIYKMAGRPLNSGKIMVTYNCCLCRYLIIFSIRFEVNVEITIAYWI